jgi:archaellum component FlaD/FlaE
MAVNQNQVDHIIPATSEDGSEVKMQNLEREVDLIKTSIKRLLMDIRERMNERENPFTITPTSPGGSTAGSEMTVSHSTDETKKTVPEAGEATPNNTGSGAKKPQPKVKAEPVVPAEAGQTPQPVPFEEERKILDEQVLSLLKSQVPAPAHKLNHSPPFVNEKIRLQKVYKLFKWTNMAIQKFGHDRLEIILESYRIMGYISKEACDEIKEISRLMPANLGEEHEVGPDEFVSELYALNRIIAPNDTSLDRDMIEVMMEQRQQGLPPRGKTEVPEIPVKVREASRNSKRDEEWMNLPDRI